jgi:transposase
MVTIGLDPHPDSHTVAALDEKGTTLASLTVTNNAEGLVLLHQFACSFSEHRWAVEGAANRFIVPFVNELLARGEVVHHIPPNLTSQYRARLSRKKNDVVDAQNAARAFMANPSLPTFCPGQSQRELQDLTRTQRRLSEQLKANKMALQALDVGSPVRPALTQVIQVLEIQLTKLAEQMKTLVKASAPMLLEILGVGPVVASVILGEVGTIERFANEGQFASYCGAAPVERGSGKNSRMQLNHGGNRRLNWALHIIALTRSRCDARTKALLAKLKARGKTQRASLRILKTYIAREMFRHLKRSISPGLVSMMT